MPENLFYNCRNPVEILDSGVIKCSNHFTGISMTSWKDLGSHGPFKLQFSKASWFSHFTEVRYFKEIANPGQIEPNGKRRLARTEWYEDQHGDRISPEEYKALLNELGGRLVKNMTFADEQEYYCPINVRFHVNDVVGVFFMVNAPSSLGLRQIKKIKEELSSRYGRIYSEITVDDPYLKNKKM